MQFIIYQGKINIIDTDGKTYDYENFIVTLNPDGSRTLRTVSCSPKKDLLRDVYQKEDRNWRPIEAYGSVFYKKKFIGTVQRRIVKNNLYSWLWSPEGECDYRVFEFPNFMIVGFHAIFHESWKMNLLSTKSNKFQELTILTVSNTWNGKTISHGSVLRSKARYDGLETIEVPAGVFDCKRFTWLTPFGKELVIWSHGKDSIFIKMLVSKGNNEGFVYQLSQYNKI